MVGNSFDEEIENLLSIDSSGNLVLPAGMGLLATTTLGIGYSTGAGGTALQTGNKAGGVTISKPCGVITMDNAELAAAGEVEFAVTNTLVAATDIIAISIASGGTSSAYVAAVTTVAAGSFNITLCNLSAGALSEAVVINFVVIKGVAT